ncbi:hypothetical protein Hanom_Chr02g00163391 [Helianthus anomalus]
MSKVYNGAFNFLLFNFYIEVSCTYDNDTYNYYKGVYNLLSHVLECMPNLRIRVKGVLT